MGRNGIDGGMNRVQVAEYLQDMVAELRGMSSEAGFDFLSYLLDMAALEAATIVREGDRLPSPEHAMESKGAPLTPVELARLYMEEGDAPR